MAGGIFEGAASHTKKGLVLATAPLFLRIGTMEEGNNLASDEDGNLREGKRGKAAIWHATPVDEIAIESCKFPGKFVSLRESGVGTGPGGPATRFEIEVVNAEEGVYRLKAKNGSGYLATKDEDGEEAKVGEDGPMSKVTIWQLRKGDTDAKEQLTGDHPFKEAKRGCKFCFHFVKARGLRIADEDGTVDCKGAFGAVAQFFVHASKKVRFQNLKTDKFLRITRDGDDFALDAKGVGGPQCNFKITTHDGEDHISLESARFGEDGELHVGWKDGAKDPSKTATGPHSHVHIEYKGDGDDE